MPYIGRGPSKSGAFRILDDISLDSHTSGGFNGSRTTFALTVGTVALTVGLPETLMIAVDGVIQEPGTAYTISGSNIVFASPPQDSATFWGVELGDVGGLAERATTQAGTDDSTRIATTAHVKDVKIDDLTAGDDNTDLDSSTGRHGLLRKLDGTATNFLNGAGNWAAAGGLRGIIVLNPQGIDNTSTGALGVVAPHPWVGCRPTGAGNDGSAFFTGSAPSDFTTLNSAKLVCLGVEGSTNVRLGANTCKIAAHSEINTTHSNTMAVADYAVTTNEIMHIDISSLFTNLAANDSFAFNIRRNGSHGNDTVTTFYIYSAILEYS